MFTRTSIALALAISCVACTMWSKPAKGWAGQTGGDNIERLFWDDVVHKDFAKVDAHVSSSFVGSGPTGAMDRAAFLQWLHAAGISGVRLNDCSNRVNGADVIITCVAERDGAASGRVNTLSVWQEYKKGWLLVAHSETPAAP